VTAPRCPYCRMEIKAEEVRNYQIFEGWAAGCDSKGCPGELDDGKRSPKKADAIKKALEASHPSTQPASTGAAQIKATLEEVHRNIQEGRKRRIGDVWFDDAELHVRSALALLVDFSRSHDALVEALKKHGSHAHSEGPMCERAKHSEYPCTCGLDAALKAATGGENGG
jgi:hypothetical protein